MGNYRRNYVPGGTYFFTVVTYARRRFLTDELPRACLRGALRDVRRRWAWHMLAVVLLPDHFHAVWSLPPSDADKPPANTGQMRAAGCAPAEGFVA